MCLEWKSVAISQHEMEGTADSTWMKHSRSVRWHQRAIKPPQLKNALEEMCILAEDEVLQELPSFISPVEHAEDTPPIAEAGTMDDLERLAIEQTLARCNGNKTMAAKILGIGLRTLYRKIERYGIEQQ